MSSVSNERGVPDGQVLLALRGLTLRRAESGGPRTILQDVDLMLRGGELIGLLGANGSGKTSLLRYLAGESSPLSGPAGLVFQDPDEQLVGATVAEEISLGRPGLAAGDLLAEFSLRGLEDQDPRLLSAGQKQRLALAVAEAGAPAVLLCDEPTALQDPHHAGWILDRLDAWRRRSGGAVILATQRESEARRCDRLLLLADGRLIASGRPADLLARPDVQRLLGRAAGTADVAKEPPAASRPGQALRAAAGVDAPAGPAPVAVWRDVSCRFPTGGGFAGVNLEVRPGERIGITGPSGCGKSLLLALAVGMRRPDRGSCHLGGRPLCSRHVPDLEHGLALLAPQFPEYLFTRRSVREEVAVDPALAGDLPGVLAAAGLAAAVACRDPHELSSGERRRLALALVLRSGRPLLLLDEPTAALDGPGRRGVISLLAAAPAATALVVASHDCAFLQECGCRELVLGPHGLQPGRAGGEIGLRASSV
jgi:energy-coupling factor transporter ATP-binding protein EcfA2